MRTAFLTFVVRSRQSLSLASAHIFKAVFARCGRLIGDDVWFKGTW